MAYAIMRWSKLTSKAQADLTTGHNYRQQRVANADEQAPHPNKEFINEAGRGYWELASERIGEAVTRKVRDDAVRGMEVILTGSPEAFERGPDGRAVDYANSSWARDNVDFLKKTFGEKNVISCTLHQDEKTPHFHAVVVPITEDGRLSAKDLFNPTTLREYQSQYAEAMQPHGMERGVKHSQAQHQEMGRLYGQQVAVEQVVGQPVARPGAYQFVPVERPGARDLLNLDKWAAEQSQRVNEPARRQVEAAHRQVEAANERAEKATQQAQERAAAVEQVQALQKRLATTEGLKEAAQTKLTQAVQAQARLAVQLVQGKAVPASVQQLGTRLREEDRLDTQKTLEKLLVKGTYSDLKGYLTCFTDKGFRLRKATEDNPNHILHPKNGSQFTWDEVRPNGRKMSEQVDEVLQARETARQNAQRAAEQTAIRQAEAVRQAVATRELALMDKALANYRWRVGPQDLTACLVVPAEKARQVEENLRVPGLSHAAALLVQGEPHRRDGYEAVYVKYEAAFAHQVSAYFDQVRAKGDQVYEHPGSQARREQLRSQPLPERNQAQERELTPKKSRGFGIG